MDRSVLSARLLQICSTLHLKFVHLVQISTNLTLHLTNVRKSLLLYQIQLLSQEYWLLTLLLSQIILLNRLLVLYKNLFIMVRLVFNAVLLQIYSTLHLKLAQHAQISTDSILHLTNAIRNLQLFQTQIPSKDYLSVILLYSLIIQLNK